MTEFYIVRHGETDSNTRKKCLGHKDVPLNETGRRQAVMLAERLRGITFDAAYTSPLQRAADTAARLTNGRKNLTLAMSYGLIERDYGEWDDMTFDEIREATPEEYTKWLKNWTTYRIPGGESAYDIQARVNSAIDKLIGDYPGKRVLIVTHLGTARHIISHLLGLTIEQSWLFTLDNAKAAVINVDEYNKGLLTGLNI